MTDAQKTALKTLGDAYSALALVMELHEDSGFEHTLIDAKILPQMDVLEAAHKCWRLVEIE